MFCAWWGWARTRTSRPLTTVPLTVRLRQGERPGWLALSVVLKESFQSSRVPPGHRATPTTKPAPFGRWSGMVMDVVDRTRVTRLRGLHGLYLPACWAWQCRSSNVQQAISIIEDDEDVIRVVGEAHGRARHGGIDDAQHKQLLEERSCVVALQQRGNVQHISNHTTPPQPVCTQHRYAVQVPTPTAWGLRGACTTFHHNPAIHRAPPCTPPPHHVVVNPPNT